MRYSCNPNPGGDRRPWASLAWQLGEFQVRERSCLKKQNNTNKTNIQTQTQNLHKLLTHTHRLGHLLSPTPSPPSQPYCSKSLRLIFNTGGETLMSKSESQILYCLWDVTRRERLIMPHNECHTHDFMEEMLRFPEFKVIGSKHLQSSKLSAS
jgi:hypothetical protein